MLTTLRPTLIIALGTLLLSCTAQLPEEVASHLQDLSLYRSKVEQRARWLIADYRSGVVSESDFITGKRAYIDAKANVDAVIDRLKLELQSRRNPADSRDYRAAVDAACDSMYRFVILVDSVVNNRLVQQYEQAKGVTIQPKLTTSWPELVVALKNILDDERDRSAARIDRIVDDLEKLRLRTFEELDSTGATGDAATTVEQNDENQRQ